MEREEEDISRGETDLCDEVANENLVYVNNKENFGKNVYGGAASISKSRYENISPSSSISSALPPLGNYSPNSQHRLATKLSVLRKESMGLHESPIRSTSPTQIKSARQHLKNYISTNDNYSTLFHPKPSTFAGRSRTNSYAAPPTTQVS